MEKFRQVLLVAGLLMCSLVDSLAQDIDKIRRDAERNEQLSREHQRERSSSSSSFSRRSSSSSSDPLGLLIAEAVCAAIEGIAIVQGNMLEKKDSVPEMVSVETAFDANISTNASFLFKPRLRANWGLFSTEARFYNLVARDSLGTYGRFTYFDWQPVMINIFAQKAFKFRGGMGLTYEYFTQNTYTEYSLQAEVVPAKNFVIKGEGRWAIDYSTMVYVRQEAIVELDYKVKVRKHWDFFVGFNASYNNLYHDNEFWTFGPLFRVRLQ